jgi:transcriptional regulator with XRE-family HTH domain
VSQEELAEAVRVSVGTVSNLERGRVDTDPVTVAAIGKVLDVDLTPVALSASSALGLALDAMERKYDELSPTDRLVFVAQMYEFASRWPHDQRARQPTPVLARAEYEAELRRIPGVTEYQIEAALTAYDAEFSLEKDAPARR